LEGQAPEAKKINRARKYTLAFHISLIEFPKLKETMPMGWVVSPSSVIETVTVAPTAPNMAVAKKMQFNKIQATTPTRTRHGMP